MKEGDSATYTQDKELAAALITVGIPLLKGEGIVSKRTKGIVHTFWSFESSNPDGDLLTADLVKYYGEEGWFEENPHHPFTIAVHAIWNLKQLDVWEEEQVPFEVFDLGNDRLLHCRVGSEDHQECLEQGLKPQ